MSAVSNLLADKPVAFYPTLAKVLGGVTHALFFQQIAHWSSHSRDGWVFRTQDELEEELFMSAKVQANCRKKLVDAGFLEEEHRQGNRLFYRPVWDALEEALADLPKGRNRNSEREKPESPKGQVLYIRDENKYENKEVSASADQPTAFTYIAHFAECFKREHPNLVGPMGGKKAQWGKEFKARIAAGDSHELLLKTAERMAERYPAFQSMTVSRVRDDVVSNQSTSSTATPPVARDALLNFTEHGRQPFTPFAHLMDQFDFTSDADPPWQIKKELGGIDSERDYNAKGMRVIAQRAMRGGA